MSGGSGQYFTLLEQFNDKAIPDPQTDNTQIQKVAAPTDSATVSDGNQISITVSARPFTYGVAKYAQSQYGG